MGIFMADGLDLINTIRIQDMQIDGKNRDTQYDLDRRAERLERKTGVRPMDWEDFNQASPPTAPKSTLENVMEKAGTFALIVGVIVGAIAAVTTGALIPAVMGAAAGAAWGALGGALVGALDDQKPEIRRDQLGKYETYLNTFQKEHPAIEKPVSLEQDAGTKWRDSVENSPRGRSIV